MKKNLMSVIILSLCFLNIILSALIVFTMVPTIIRTNKLIAKVASNIDFEIESLKEDEKEFTLSVDDIEPYHIEKDMPINLTDIPGSNETTFGLVNVTLSLNKKSKDYETIGANMATYEEFVKEIIQNEISKLTKDNFQESKESVKVAILEEIAKKFNSDVIINISFGNYVTQTVRH